MALVPKSSASIIPVSKPCRGGVVTQRIANPLSISLAKIQEALDNVERRG
jgi:hypothetical protein